MAGQASSEFYWDFTLFDDTVSTTSSGEEESLPAGRYCFPVKQMRNSNGIPWTSFEHTRDGVKMEYTMRCDIESVDTETLSPDFRSENCIYPRALVPSDQNRNKQFNYEKDCNRLGWALADINRMFCGKRDTLRRAVLAYRHTYGDLTTDGAKLPPPDLKSVPQNDSPLDLENQLKLLEQQCRARARSAREYVAAVEEFSRLMSQHPAAPHFLHPTDQHGGMKLECAKLRPDTLDQFLQDATKLFTVCRANHGGPSPVADDVEKYMWELIDELERCYSVKTTRPQGEVPEKIASGEVVEKQPVEEHRADKRSSNL